MSCPEAIVLLASRELPGAAPGPHLLITAGVHGDEFEGMAAVRRLIALFQEPAVARSLRGRLTLVPVVNEPAWRRGQRAGDDGLDLARNCPGRADGSPTEQIAAALSALIRGSDYYIDLHTGGTALRIWPLAGYTLHADRAVLEAQRRMARAFNLPVVWGTTPHLEGRSLSVARDAGVPAIYAEHGGGGGCDPAGVEAYVDGCMGVMAELGMLDRPRAASRVRHIVEDARADSGHLQICHPSPQDGYFEPAVQLGDRVAAGDVLGTVCDTLGTSRETVWASHGGLVLVLRSFPQVKAGDSLAVVLEI
jgi:predicted deacylase